jgi:hypothetical protein
VEEVFENRALQERLVQVYAQAETLIPGDRLAHVSGVGEQPEVATRLLLTVQEAFPALRPG